VTVLLRKRVVELCGQLDEVEATKRDEWDGYSRQPVTRVDGNLLLNWKVKAKSLLQSACGSDSQHFKVFEENESGSFLTNYEILKRLQAVFLAAREDFEGGYLHSIRSLVQAEVFDSELEQATALLESGYRSAAAVIAGVVLETALRDLCSRKGMAVGKLDKMNADLAKAGLYSVLTQKRITALADIRNSAAHGHPERFNDDDTASMIKDVERILRDNLTAA
jgi:hypothetical protein